MTEHDLQQILSRMTRKHKAFRPIDYTLHATGANIRFADIPTIDQRTIANWLYAAGAQVLYTGREARMDGFVMLAEIR